jgi:cytochrome c oxidase cbb3-type subunit 4
MSYDALRHFADSWGLVFLFGIFLIAIGRALVPGARAQMEEARRIPLNDDEGPAQ